MIEAAKRGERDVEKLIEYGWGGTTAWLRRAQAAPSGYLPFSGRQNDYLGTLRITVLSGNKQEMQFDVRESRGKLFAAELEALAAIIRSRVIRAKLIGEESN